VPAVGSAAALVLAAVIIGAVAPSWLVGFLAHIRPRRKNSAAIDYRIRHRPYAGLLCFLSAALFEVPQSAYQRGSSEYDGYNRRAAAVRVDMATAFVVATGTFGALLGLPILTWLRIENPVARGLAMRTVAHGQGTAMALTEGEQQGAMAGMAMGLAGVFTSIIAPILIPLLI